MADQRVFTLTNKQNGSLAFKIFDFEHNGYFDHVQRHNYYTLIWVRQGSGSLIADFQEHPFESNSLFSFVPYQPFMITGKEKLSGTCICFHSDFFCIYQHHHEVGCDGVMFNNIYDPPFVKLSEAYANTLDVFSEQMFHEVQLENLAQYDLLVSLLKIFLINVARAFTEKDPSKNDFASSEKVLLQALRKLIEVNYTKRFTAADYAELLHVTPKHLARVMKTAYNKTITDMISEKVMIESKRLLYLTTKPIKEIAYELGYEDEHYFSRFFKVNSDISPQQYRETVGFGRGEMMM